MALIDDVKEVVVEQLNCNADEVKEESKFVEDLGADSLDVVELVMALEEKFDIEIPDADAEAIATVGDALKYIENNSLSSLDDLLEIEGIDARTLSVWARDLIEKIDINEADEETLEKIPEISSKLASKIVKYRKEHGPFQSLEDLLEIKGLGKKKLAGIRPHVTLKRAKSKAKKG